MNTEHDPILAEILGVVRPLTPSETARLKSVRFIDYVADRERGAKAADLLGIYPQAAAFEKMHIDNIQARIADDRICQTTGERGRICDVDVSSDSPSRYGDFR